MGEKIMGLEQIGPNKEHLEKAAEIKERRTEIELKQDWKNFYRTVFNIESDFSKLEIPKRKEGFDFLVIMEKGITAQQIFDKCSELFPIKTDIDSEKINEAFPFSGRDSTENAYAIWVRKGRIDGDEKWADYSAKDIHEMGVKTETLAERLMYELRSYKSEGVHSNESHAGLCAGSRNYSDPNSDFPCVVRVWWDDVDGKEALLIKAQSIKRNTLHAIVREVIAN